MRMLPALATALVAAWAAAAAVPPAAAAAVCKDTVSAKARSAAQVSDATRLKRARANAIGNWKRRVRDTYGWSYSFWSKAMESDVKCGGGASAKHCTATAKPCRLY
jgi:hypothetical protein